VPSGQPAAELPDEPTTTHDVPATEQAPPDAAPTVAWSPPPAAEPPAPPASAPLAPPPAAEPPSATPPPVSTGWEVPSVPPPIVPRSEGWQTPGATSQPTMVREGYVVGSTGSRFVAWLIDNLLVSIVPVGLALFVVDWSDLFRQMFEQLRFDENGRLIPNYGATYTIPMTLDLVLVYLIIVGIQFIYFVGFWTSRYQATPGMIGLKLRVVDARTGATLTLVQAVKRWIGLGYPLGLLVLVPPLQSVASLAQFALNAFLFLSTVVDPRRQGLHDKFAGSQAIRHVSSGAGATAVGCLVWGIMLIMLWVALVVVLVVVAGPSFFEFAEDLRRSTP
jgi:uncharacterized RDD family membrane protein YckC